MGGGLVLSFFIFLTQSLVTLLVASAQVTRREEFPDHFPISLDQVEVLFVMPKFNPIFTFSKVNFKLTKKIL